MCVAKLGRIKFKRLLCTRARTTEIKSKAKQNKSNQF